MTRAGQGTTAAARMDAAPASVATGVTAHRADVTPGEVIRAVEAALQSRQGSS